jgi:tetratricopeptide (TPR) repeat protein
MQSTLLIDRENMLLRSLQLILLGLCVFGADIQAATPEEEELARQAAFRNGMQEIVAALNTGSTERFIAVTDREAIVERIFGLRLIDQKVKRQFEEDLEFRYDGMISSAIPATEDGIKATLLGVESRGDRGRAVVRFDLPAFQFNYHEYELRLDDRNRLFIVDWIDFLQGESFSDGIGMLLIKAAPGRPAVRKLIDFQNVRDSDLFQFTELLKAARDRQAERFVEIINGLDERLQQQRVVVLTSVQLTKQIRNRRMQRTALMKMAQYYPEEPLFSLMLLDFYFPARMYDEAHKALLRLDDRLGVEDAAMQARLSAATLVLGDSDAAIAHADKALSLESGLELAWWSALRARAATRDFPGAVAAIQQLEADFGHTLDRPALERDRSFAELLASDEYLRWRAEGS